jgi:hypothetical protein
LFAGQIRSADSTQIAATLDLDRLGPGIASNASPVFLTDSLLSLTVHISERSKILLLSLSNGKLQLLAQTELPYSDEKAFSVSNNRLLIAGVRKKYLFSAALRQQWEMPMTGLCHQFPGTAMIGEAGLGEKSRVFALTAPPTSLPHDRGQLLAVSSDVLVYGTSEAIRVEKPNGDEKGVIPIANRKHLSNSVEVAGPGRLYLAFPREERVVDFSGRTIARIHPPAGWGFRHGWSTDGSRLLFDHFLANTSLADRALDFVAETLGLTLPKESKGEVVRVVDVSTGTVYFDLERANMLLGEPGSYHADISPSGDLVAVSTTNQVTIYRLSTSRSDK